jgi:hypothetical protein
MVATDDPDTAEFQGWATSTTFGVMVTDSLGREIRVNGVTPGAAMANVQRVLEHERAVAEKRRARAEAAARKQAAEQAARDARFNSLLEARQSRRAKAPSIAKTLDESPPKTRRTNPKRHGKAGRRRPLYWRKVAIQGLAKRTANPNRWIGPLRRWMKDEAEAALLPKEALRHDDKTLRGWVDLIGSEE